MRNLKFLLFIAIAFQSFTANAQEKNADTLIHKVFASLKAKDEKAFIALFPSGEQLARFMRPMMEQLLKSEEMMAMMAADESTKNLNIDSLINAEIKSLTDPASFAEMEKSFAGSFHAIIKKGEDRGIKWRDAKLNSYTLDSTDVKEGDGPAGMGGKAPAGMKQMTGVLDFSSGGTDYQLALDKAVWLPAEKAWFGAEFKQVAKKGESLEPDNNNPLIPYKVPPAAQENKPVQKQATKSTKSKTTTKTSSKKIKK